jgi:DNA-directed RNA polymerase subunit RPC12/RpoP
MDSQEHEDPQEDPVIACWVECADCGWKTREYGAHEDIPLITTCPYCTYGGNVVVKTRTASEALAKVDFIGGIGIRPVGSPDTETEDTRSGGD